MPSLLLLGHTATTSPDFSVDDLAGTGGRLDVLIRGLTTGLLTSHGIRRDWRVDLLLLGPPQSPKMVTFDGAKVRHLNPDERSTAMTLKKVLAEPVPGKVSFEVLPGVVVSRQGLGDLLAGTKVPVYLCKEGGADLWETDLPREALFLLSDHLDPTAEETALLAKHKARPLDLGPVSLQVHQAVAVLQNAWDRQHQTP